MRSLWTSRRVLVKNLNLFRKSFGILYHCEDCDIRNKNSSTSYSCVNFSQYIAGWFYYAVSAILLVFGAIINRILVFTCQEKLMYFSVDNFLFFNNYSSKHCFEIGVIFVINFPLKVLEIRHDMNFKKV